MNRRIRNRTCGGVGGGDREAPSYPIACKAVRPPIFPLSSPCLSRGSAFVRGGSRRFACASKGGIVGVFGGFVGKRWCREEESNLRPRPYQGRALPLSYRGVIRANPGATCHRPRFMARPRLYGPGAGLGGGPARPGRDSIGCQPRQISH